MKRKTLIASLFALLTLTSCTSFLQNLDGTSTSLGGGNFPTSSSTSEKFNANNIKNGGSVIQELANEKGSVSIDLVVENKTDGQLLQSLDINISRKKEIEWGLVELNSYVPGDEYNLVYGGAIEFLDEGIDVYYTEDGENYTYYGPTYDPTKDFNIQELESYLTLDPTYVAALAAVGRGTIEYIAGQQCLTFEVAGEYINEYHPGSTLKVSVSLTNYMLMKLHLTTYSEDSFGLPVVNEYLVKVEKIEKASKTPKLEK